MTFPLEPPSTLVTEEALMCRRNWSERKYATSGEQWHRHCSADDRKHVLPRLLRPGKYHVDDNREGLSVVVSGVEQSSVTTSMRYLKALLPATPIKELLITGWLCCDGRLSVTWMLF